MVLTTTDVGNLTQGQEFRITKCYPSVVCSMSTQFAIGFVSFFGASTHTQGIAAALRNANTWFWVRLRERGLLPLW